MATCLLYAVGATTGRGFVWQWRTIDGRKCADQTFLYFHDCMKDAEAHGHVIDLAATIDALRDAQGAFSAEKLGRR